MLSLTAFSAPHLRPLATRIHAATQDFQAEQAKLRADEKTGTNPRLPLATWRAASPLVFHIRIRTVHGFAAADHIPTRLW